MSVAEPPIVAALITEVRDGLVRSVFLSVGAGSAIGRFPTPASSRWSELDVRFLCNERVAVTIRDQREVLTYAQLALVDSRNGRPSKQWEVLYSFGKGNGMMTWLSPDACRKNRKRRELLSQSLKRFFDIFGEPIEPTDDRKGWRCVFKLRSEDSERPFSSSVGGEP